MKGKAIMVTSVSFQDILNMKMTKPVPLMALLRKTLTFWEMRSLTWVVSADRRDRMSPVGTRGQGTASGTEQTGSTESTERFHVTGVVFIKKGDFLRHQGSEEAAPEPEV